MKKGVYACILIVAVIVSFILGMVYANSNHSKADIVGVYQTDSWNGKIGTLVLYEDGTCQYPTGANATWESGENTVYITIEKDVLASAHEAKIMENGLVLHGAFFKKVSD